MGQRLEALEMQGPRIEGQQRQGTVSRSSEGYRARAASTNRLHLAQIGSPTCGFLQNISLIPDKAENRRPASVCVNEDITKTIQCV